MVDKEAENLQIYKLTSQKFNKKRQTTKRTQAEDTKRPLPKDETWTMSKHEEYVPSDCIKDM